MFSTLTFRLTALLFLVAQATFAQDSPYTVRFTRTRQPAFDVSKYKVIGVGDIVGATGHPTPNAMNVTDNIDNQLVKKDNHEIVDHNALKQLTGSKGPEIITDVALTSLAKKNQSSVLITGRIQSEKVNQNLKTTTSGIANCPVRYWYESFGDFTVQVKVFEAKSAKMVYAEVIKVPMTRKSKEGCEKTAPMDEEQIQREAAVEAAEQIAHLLFAYEETLQVTLQKPLLSSAFKELRNVAVFLSGGDRQQGLSILEKYTTDPALKDKVKPYAFYNYGVGLYVDGQLAKAREQFVKAFNLMPTEPAYKVWMDKIDKELAFGTK